MDTDKFSHHTRLKLWAKQNPTHPLCNDIVMMLEDFKCLWLDYQRDVPPDESVHPQPRREGSMPPLELEVLGSHAVALAVASELLAEASNKATATDWLTLILLKARTQYEEMSPEQLQACLKQTIDLITPPDESSPDA